MVTHAAGAAERVALGGGAGEGLVVVQPFKSAMAPASAAPDSASGLLDAKVSLHRSSSERSARGRSDLSSTARRQS